MNQSSNSTFRVLARDVAQELNTDELAQVSGGEVTGGSASGKATWSEKTGNDFEISGTITWK